VVPFDAENESRALCAAAQRNPENQSPLVRASRGQAGGTALVLQLVLRRGVCVASAARCEAGADADVSVFAVP